ncbi:MAG: universal stress protein [Ferruginibacter sp.]
MKTVTTIKNILAATDFSELAANAIEVAIAECKRQQAALHILHVVENRLMIAPPEANMASVYVLPQMEGDGNEKLNKLAASIKDRHNIIVKTYLEFGNPADAIRDKAIELKCDLIVLGTHGASGFRNLFIGSTAYNVIKNTTIPVLTIPGKIKIKDFKKILFPIRAANGIMEKYGFIKPVIKKNEAELIILGLSLSTEIFDIDDRKTELLKLGQSLGLNSTAFKSTFHVCKNYAKKVLEISRKEKADLIVINATLDYTWNQFFIGPYAQQIINHAKVPVLSIRTPDPVGPVKQPLKKDKTGVQPGVLSY